MKENDWYANQERIWSGRELGSHKIEIGKISDKKYRIEWYRIAKRKERKGMRVVDR